MKIGAVIIAAGLSSRMGEFKPLLTFGKRSALHCCVELFQNNNIENIIVVTGHRYKEIEHHLKDYPVTLVHNRNYQKGMFTSICTALATTSHCDGFFLLPVDIPLVRTSTVTELIKNFDGTNVLHPFFNKTQGHPPLIPGQYIPKILSHNGDGGLHMVLSGLPNKNIDVWDEACLLDMDREEDYLQLQKLNRRQSIGTRREAEVLARKFMPAKGVRHGEKTAEIALRLAKYLPHRLDLDLVHNAALLHDIAKGHQNHEKAGGTLVEQLGFKALSTPISKHQSFPAPENISFNEDDIICLADKIVRGCSVIGVHKRFQEKLQQYHNDPDAISAIQKRFDNALASLASYEKICNTKICDILPELR